MTENITDYQKIRSNFWTNYSYWVGLIFVVFFVLILERNYFQKVEVMTRDAIKEKRQLEAKFYANELKERLLFRPERIETIAKKMLKMKEPPADKVVEIVIN